MPGLLVTDQIARAANVEVMAGMLKTRAKRVEVGKHLQPLLRRLRNQPIGGRGQISISAGLGPPHTSAKLVKLRQPEAVRAMNDEGIGAWDIKPALHDGRGKQHIIALVVKGRHALFDLRWRHLSVRSEEHTSELQSLMRISYAVFCLKKKKSYTN